MSLRVLSKLSIFTILWLGIGCTAVAADAYTDVYYMHRYEGAVGSIAVLAPITLHVGDDGDRLKATVSWFEYRRHVPSYGFKSTQLDLDDPAQRALAQVLDNGFDFRFDKDRRFTAVESSLDETSIEMLTSESEYQNTYLATRRVLGELFPWSLPSDVQIGQRVNAARVSALGTPVTLSMVVEAVNHQWIQLRIEDEAQARDVEGRLIVDRASGMPVEALLTWMIPADQAASKGSYITTYLVSQRHAQTLEGVTSASFFARNTVGEVRERWNRSDPVASGWLMKDEQYASLLPSPLSPQAEKRFQSTLAFRTSPQVMNGAIQMVRDFGIAWPPGPGQLPLRLREVALRDRHGDPLTRARAIVDRRYETLPSFLSSSGIEESEEAFPFRPALSTPASVRREIDAIELEVDVGGYTEQSREIVQAGETSGDPQVRIQWSEHAVEVRTEAPFGETATFIMVPVPLDAHGNVLPFEPMFLDGRWLDEAPPVTLLGTQWRKYTAARVVTLAPIAAIELRRYRLDWQPQTWRYSNIGPMFDVRGELDPDAKPIGVQFEDHLPSMPTLVDGESLLESSRLERFRSSRNSETFWAFSTLPAHVDAMTTYCRVDSKWGTVAKLMKGDDRIPGPDAAYPFRLLDPYVTDTEITVECPRRIETLREPLDASRCFEGGDNGWVNIRPACRAEIEAMPWGGEIFALDAEGFPLRRITARERPHALRFWGRPVSIRYSRISEDTVVRTFSLPAPVSPP